MVSIVVVYVYVNGSQMNLLDFSLQELQVLEKAIEDLVTTSKHYAAPVYKCLLGNACEDGKWGSIKCYEAATNYRIPFSEEWSTLFLGHKFQIRPTPLEEEQWNHPVEILMRPISASDVSYEWFDQ